MKGEAAATWTLPLHTKNHHHRQLERGGARMKEPEKAKEKRWQPKGRLPVAENKGRERRKTAMSVAVKGEEFNSSAIFE